METNSTSSATAFNNANSFIDHRNQQYDDCCKSNISRRSVDWRDSGIVIDDDHQFFSAEGIGDYNTSQPLITINNPIPSVERIFYDQDDDGDTTLHLAVVGFTQEKVKDLIKICDLDAINNMMQTPLHVATMANRPEMVELLLEAGAKVDVHDRRGNTPLHLSCQNGYLEIGEIILDGVSKQAKSTSRDGLSVKQLIEMTNFDGQTCLHLAAINNRQKVIDMLVNKFEADPNFRDSKSGATILHKAIQNFNSDLVVFILNLDKHCNGEDYSGRKPIDMIRILSDSVTDEARANMLYMVGNLINERITKCAEQKGCSICLEQLNRIRVDSSSPSSSDYSDSESDTY